MSLATSARSCGAWPVVIALAIGLASACAGTLGAPGGTPLRISQITDVGDSRRQASVRLVIEGLDAELAGAALRALGRYERAIQIDPGNPFVYLALARYYVSIADAERALENLDRVQSLLPVDSRLSPRVEPHVLGLRGGALQELGRTTEADRLLARARQLAPSVWGDARLDVRELR